MKVIILIIVLMIIMLAVPRGSATATCASRLICSGSPPPEIYVFNHNTINNINNT